MENKKARKYNFCGKVVIRTEKNVVLPIDSKGEESI